MRREGGQLRARIGKVEGINTETEERVEEGQGGERMWGTDK